VQLSGSGGVTHYVTSNLFDVTATMDWMKCTACADVILDGQKLFPQISATYLLFLERQLVDLHTFVRKLLALDASVRWLQPRKQRLPSMAPQ
jgi:hypothetical protein